MNLKIFFLIGLLTLTFCSPPKTKVTSPTVLAFVNGQTIFENQLRHRISLERAKYDDKTLSQKDLFDPIKRNLLDKMIQNKAIADWGLKNNYVLSSEELAESIKALKKGYTDKAFESFLSDKNVTFSEWRDMLEDNLLAKKITDQEVFSKINITPKEVGQYYQSHLKEFKVSESVRARHIVTDTQEKAQKILSLLKKGENFAKVAIMHSLSPDRANGGDLGYFEKGTHPEVFDTTCFKLEVGELSPIVKSSYGYHIFKLVDKRPAHIKTLDEASPEIYAGQIHDKMREAYQTWLDSILKESQIRLIEENIKKMKFIP